MSEQQANVDSQKIDFQKKFEMEREEWTEKIRVLSIRMKNIKEVADVQIDLFSNRQILIEYTAKLTQVLSKLNAKHRKDRSERLRYYSESHQVKYGSNEKTPLIEGDLSELKERIDTVEGQLSFINETVKTVDFMLYGVKNRVYLEDYMRSGVLKRD